MCFLQDSLETSGELLLYVAAHVRRDHRHITFFGHVYAEARHKYPIRRTSHSSFKTRRDVTRNSTLTNSTLYLLLRYCATDRGTSAKRAWMHMRLQRYPSKQRHFKKHNFETRVRFKVRESQSQSWSKFGICSSCFISKRVLTIIPCMLLLINFSI